MQSALFRTTNGFKEPTADDVVFIGGARPKADHVMVQRASAANEDGIRSGVGGRGGTISSEAGGPVNLVVDGSSHNPFRPVAGLLIVMPALSAARSRRSPHFGKGSSIRIRR